MFFKKMINLTHWYQCWFNNSKEGEAAPVAANEQTELRRRKRDEKNKALAEKVAEMKKKQRDSEDWNKNKPFYQYIGIGVGLCVGAFLLYRWFSGGGGVGPSLA